MTADVVEALARRIAPDAAQNPNAEIAALARAVAEAQIDIIRVRRVRHELLATALGHRAADPRPADQVSDLLSGLASQLATMDRYERRALARRKFAIRDFDAAAAANSKGKGQNGTNEPDIHQ